MTDQGISPETVQNEEAAKPVKKKQKTGRSPEVLDKITDVYRHYDKDGVLLYVGISLSAFQRMKGHRHESAWFNRIALITVEHHETRGRAEVAEACAIKYEQPLFNKAVPWAPDLHPLDVEEDALRRRIETAEIIKLFKANTEERARQRKAKLNKLAEKHGVAGIP